MRVNISPRSAQRPRDPLRRQAQPEAHVLRQRRLDLVQDLLERAGERHAAQHLEALVGAAEVRLGVLDDAAERLQRRPLRLQHARSPPARPAARRGRGSRRSAARARSPLEAAHGDGSEIDSGSRGSGPASAREQQRDVARPCARSSRAPATGSTGRPARGRESGPARGAGPTRLQNAAGLRTRAPRSDPSANGSIPPRPRPPRRRWTRPASSSRSYGLRVAPKTALNVCEPAPNSGVFVLPITIAPAARSRSTSSESRLRHVCRRTAASRTSCASRPCPRGP